MKTETTTHKPTTAGKKVVLITGGYAGGQENNATQHSAEIFLPNSPGNPCILPDLPERYYAHTQVSGMICGGYYTQNTCRKWSPIEGNFPEKPVDSFKPGRYFLVSWTPVSEKETFLIGGGLPSSSQTLKSKDVSNRILKSLTFFFSSQRKFIFQINDKVKMAITETSFLLPGRTLYPKLSPHQICNTRVLHTLSSLPSAQLSSPL